MNVSRAHFEQLVAPFDPLVAPFEPLVLVAQRTYLNVSINVGRLVSSNPVMNRCEMVSVQLLDMPALQWISTLPSRRRFSAMKDEEGPK